MGFFASVDGEIVPLEEARVSVLDNGFLFGDSVYEVLRTYGGHPFESGRHLRRMRASADRLGIGVPLSDEALLQQVTALLERAGDVESYIRIVVTRGVGNSSYDFDAVKGPTVVMIQREMKPPSERHYTEGIRLSAVDVRRNHALSLDPAIKSSNLLNNILALREARDRGGEEPVLLNHAGQIAEGASKVTFGMLTGSSFQALSWSNLALRLSNQDPNPLWEVNPTLAHGAGTLLKKIESIRASIFSVIVSSPLKASSTSNRDPTITLIRIFMYSHSWRKAF